MVIDARTNFRRRPTSLALTVVSACFLFGCSASPDATAPRVASLQSEVPRAGASVDPQDLRPLMRLDTSQAEKDSLFKVWFGCLTAQYGPAQKYTKAWAVGREQAHDPKWTAAKAACLTKEPEDFADREMRKDLPAFKDKQRVFHKCAENKGYKLTPMDSDTGQFGLTEVGANGDWDSAGIQDCMRQAFAPDTMKAPHPNG